MYINGYITLDESGFYSLIDGKLFFAMNSVNGPDFSLSRDQRLEYTYPINGWSWFDSLDEACASFQIDSIPYKNPPDEVPSTSTDVSIQ